jgi:hypothetical protein
VTDLSSHTMEVFTIRLSCGMERAIILLLLRDTILGGKFITRSYVGLWLRRYTTFLTLEVVYVVYYKSRKRELKAKLMNESVR